MHVHVGPGYAGHAVEPEARHRREIPPDGHDETVPILLLLVVVPEEELAEGLHLPGDAISTALQRSLDSYELVVAHDSLCPVESSARRHVKRYQVSGIEAASPLNRR